MDPKLFESPPTAYRGVTLWMLNDKLETDEIVRQLEGFHDAGWGAVIDRTFNGLLTEYLSDEWMEMVEAIVNRAGELGLRVWLQAGYMPSAVPDLPAELQYKGLARRPLGEPGEAGEVVLAEDPEFAYCERAHDTVLDLLNADAVTDYLNKAYKDVWYDRFGEKFGKTIEAIWVDEPHFRPKLLPWSGRMTEVFAERWGYDITEHLPELYAPVGDFMKVRHHYWRTVLGMFLTGYFEGVGRWCAAHDVKFSGHLMGEDTLNNQIAWTAAAMPCYEHMQLPGVDHLTLSLRWPTGKKFLLTPKQATSAAAQLGKDEVLAEMYAVSTHRITFAERKRIGDWLAVLGVNYRCIHGSFYSMRGRRKRIYVPHLSYQQPWWDSNRIAADYFARVSYAGRAGVPVADVLVIHPVESVFCIYDPTRMDRPHDREHEPEDATRMDTDLVNLCDNLLKIQRDFHFGDETLIAAHGEVGDAKVSVGRMTYKVVVLPGMITIRKTTLELLLRFLASGGHVLSTGEFPTRIDGVQCAPMTDSSDHGLVGRLNELRLAVDQVGDDPAALKNALDAAAVASLEILPTDEAETAEDVWVQIRQDGDDRVVFAVNTNPDRGLESTLRIRGGGKIEDWDLRTGRIATPAQYQEDGFVYAPLSLPPLGSRLFVLKTAADPVTVEATTWTATRSVQLSESMAVTRHGPNALTLDTARLRKGDGDWLEPLPIITIQKILESESYRGAITLQFAFNVQTVPDSLCVVIEDAAKYGVTINGKPVAYEGLPHFVDKSFHPVDIAAHVTEGANTLELSIDFVPVPKASFALASLYEVHEGVELESIYLIGEFDVAATVSAADERDKCVRYSPSFALTSASGVSAGNLTADGHPFFAGRVTLTDTVSLDALAEGQRALLRLPSLDAPLAKVRVNGRDADAIIWPPYETDITELIVAGDNTIEIELISSLRNLLGPHHRSSGEPDDCWRTAFDDNRDVTAFEHPEEAESTWTDDYFCIHFGFRGRAVIVTEVPE